MAVLTEILEATVWGQQSLPGRAEVVIQGAGCSQAWRSQTELPWADHRGTIRLPRWGSAVRGRKEQLGDWPTGAPRPPQHIQGSRGTRGGGRDKGSARTAEPGKAHTIWPTQLPTAAFSTLHVGPILYNKNEPLENHYKACEVRPSLGVNGDGSQDPLHMPESRMLTSLLDTMI
jgi:hypothetical protein